MNLKSKLFGTLAASAIALSMMGGVMAADSDSETISVRLSPANCSVTLTSGNGSFGEWRWDGTNTQILPAQAP